MATTNPVFKVLVPTGNQALLTIGQKVDALAVGQLGIFNWHTGLSVDGTVPADARDVFFAVGKNLTGAGAGATLEDVERSAGQMVQVRNAKSWTVKATVDEVAKVVNVTGFTAKCETNYILKIEFRNQKSYGINGYNQFTKSFSFFTGCCAPTTDCDDCSDNGDCIELAVGLAAAINADSDALVTAALFGNKITTTVGAPTSDANATVVVGAETFIVPVLDADTATEAAAKIAAFINAVTTSGYKASSSGAVLTIYPTAQLSTSAVTATTSGAGVTFTTSVNANTVITDTAAFKAAFPGACLAIRITGNAETRPAGNGSINLKYHKTGTDFIVSLVDGLGECNGTVTTLTNLQYREGYGYDLNQLIYEAGGWEGKPGPYRTSAITGLQKEGFASSLVATDTYNVTSLTYDQMSVGGWLEYLNNLETIIAIPCGDTTALQSLAAIMTLIFTQFGSMVGDVAAMDCSNSRVGLLVAATDGIESIA